MATITSLGIGSGLDLNSMVTQLVAIERQPLTLMQSAAAKLNTQVTSLGQISSLLSALQDAGNKLTDNTLWASATASSADSTAVSVAGGSGAATGNYGVTVQQLAGNQTLASATTYAAATDAVGSGTLTLQLGTWDATQSNFTGKTGSAATTITVAATDTLQSLSDKINGAGVGVTASLITDASGVRLSLRSTASGAENGFRITAADSDGNNTDAVGLSSMAFDPPSGTTGMALKQAAANAKATVNGIAVESASNDLSGVVAGVTLTLQKLTATPVNVSVVADRTSVINAIKAFATAYNAVASYIGQQTKYDATSKTGGPLQGDSAVTGLQAHLRSVLGAASSASSAFPRLSDLGLEVQRDGTLTVNDSKLTTAANNLPELKKAFANNDLTTAHANDGFARRYATLAMQALSVDGAVTTHTQGLQKLISKNSDDQATLNARVDLFQQRLVAQYTAMDANLSKLSALSSYVTQQVANWNKTTP